MNENYIVINGKKIELTEEQVKSMLVVVRNNPFEIVERGKNYFYANRYGDINNSVQCGDSKDDCLFQAANYFNDESFAKQVALHQLLYRKLLKFAYDNDFKDTAEWNGSNQHWLIRRAYDTGALIIGVDYDYKSQNVYFSSDEGAKRAGNEVIMPFMKEHPEFVW